MLIHLQRKKLSHITSAYILQLPRNDAQVHLTDDSRPSHAPPSHLHSDDSAIMNAQTLLRSTRAVRLPIHLGVRAASTSTATTAASPTSNANEKLPLTWPTYLSLRRQRRLWSTLTSIPTTAIGLIAGGGYFGSQEMDPSQLIMGIEPMWVYGGAT